VQASATPTAAAVSFRLDLPHSPPVAVTIAGGKALDAREMVVQIRASSPDPCSLVFGVQGSPDQYLSHSHSRAALSAAAAATSGPFLILKGQCWGGLALNDTGGIALPAGWGVAAGHCSTAIRRLIRPLAPAHEAAEAEAEAEAEGSECLIRPAGYLVATKESETGAGGETGAAVEEEEVAELPRSPKYQNNAYIQIIEALMANDRSYFTTTEVSQQQQPASQPLFSCIFIRYCMLYVIYITVCVYVAAHF
jgi:hypothetical protein